MSLHFVAGGRLGSVWPLVGVGTKQKEGAWAWIPLGCVLSSDDPSASPMIPSSGSPKVVVGAGRAGRVTITSKIRRLYIIIGILSLS